MSEPPPPPPHQGPPPPAPAPKQGGIVAGFAVAGASLFIVVNAVFGFVVFVAVVNAQSDSYRVFFGLAAAFGALAAFAGGAALIRLGKPAAKGIGLGLMIGWALVSICTAGFCTGINPNLYSAPLPHTAPTQIGENP